MSQAPHEPALSKGTNPKPEPIRSLGANYEPENLSARNPESKQ